MRTLIRLVVAAAMLWGCAAIAAEGNTPKKKASTKPAAATKPAGTTLLKADTITYSSQKGEVVLDGNAHVEYPTDNGLMLMDCDHVQAHTGADNRIETAVATGNVLLKTAQYKTSSAGKATFDFKANTVVLDWDGTNWMTLEAVEGGQRFLAKRLVFDLTTGKLDLGGGPGSVKGGAENPAEKPKEKPETSGGGTPTP